MAAGAPRALPTGKVTLLFTDMEGSTRLLHELGEAYGDLLVTHDRLLRDVWQRHHGVEVNTEGDAFFVAFADVEDAVAAVADAQRVLQEHPWPPGRAAVVRMGLHLGSPKLYGRDYWGVDVNYAARLCAAANGGQVLLSDAVVAAVDAPVDDLGMHALKDFPSPRRLFHLRIDDRGSDHFPAPRTLRAGRTNLPDQISTLIGRAGEIAEVAKLVDEHRLVTLSGPGGVGKTRLAMEVGAHLLDGSDGGVWLVELAGVADADWVPHAVAVALGARLRAGDDVGARIAAHVADQRMLVVLDNCEHLVDAAARLVELLLQRCPGLSVLATSREPLELDGEVVYRVPSLALPPEGTDDPFLALEHDGVRLFVERASTHRDDFRLDPTTVADAVAVVRRLDGIPLAIELAAPWLARLSLSELRTRLDRGFTLLAGGRRTALARQRTIAALIDWSYDGLPPEEQRLLQELSVFAGGFDLGAVGAVCGSAGDDEVLVLGALVDKSLVQAEDLTGDVRYRLLETVRAYAAERLAVSGAGSARVRDRHLAHYLGIAESFVAERDRSRIPRWLLALRRDRDNFRAAVSHALGGTDPELALRMASALTRF